MILGFPPFERQHTYKWEGGIILLNEISVNHHCYISSFSYFAQIAKTKFSLQIWRPSSSPDEFIFVMEIKEIANRIGLHETDVSDAISEHFPLLPGDKTGLYFTGRNPIPFDYSSVCEQVGLLYYHKAETLSYGQKVRFLKKVERNNICRYYSLSLYMRVIGKDTI